jgi:hypothetical protein
MVLSSFQKEPHFNVSDLLGQVILTNKKIHTELGHIFQQLKTQQMI